MKPDYFDNSPFVHIPNPDVPWETIEVPNPMITELDEIGSFEQYCIGHFGNSWLAGLRTMISEKQIALGKTSSQIPLPDIQFMTNADIQRVEFARMDRLHIYADAIVTAEIELSDLHREQKFVERMTQWYRLSHIITVDPQGYSVEGTSARIYNKNEKSPGLPLDEYLIPVLSTEGLEEEVDGIMLQHYPEVLMDCTPINAEKLAQRMGLRILEVPLATKALYGQAVFSDSCIETTGGRIKADAGTIVLNTSIKMDSILRERCIIHECYHYYAHDLFIWGQSLYNADIACFDCPLSLGSYPSGEKSPVFWAEWQAQQITHRIQMYRHSVRAFCEEFNARYDDDVQEHQTQGNPARKLETLIRLMAQYYNTTKLSARKRLIELGLHDVRGINNYVNDKPVPPFFFADGVLCKNQTFLIGLRDAAAEFSRNKEFRKLIASGRYIYVEGRFCLNTPEYIQAGNNGYRITDYGRMHTEECCLRFDITYREHRYQYAWGQFNWEAAPADSGMLHFIRNAAEPGLCDLEEMTHQALWSMDIRKAISGMEFGEALTYVMAAREMTIEHLEETSQISSRTIRRLRHSDGNPVKKEYIIAISVGMHLPPMVSMELLNVAGLKLTTSYKDNIYGMVLCSMYQHDIHTVNQYLQTIGIEPIGGVA